MRLRLFEIDVVVNVERCSEKVRNGFVDRLDLCVQLIGLCLARLTVGSLRLAFEALSFRVSGASGSSIRTLRLRTSALHRSDGRRLLAHYRRLLALRSSSVCFRDPLLVLDLREESALPCHWWTSQVADNGSLSMTETSSTA